MCAGHRLAALGVQVGKETKQVSVSHTGQEGPYLTLPGLVLEVRWCLCRAGILTRATQIPPKRQQVIKLCSLCLTAARLPCFINNLDLCSQHIKVNRDTSRAGNAGTSNR